MAAIPTTETDPMSMRLGWLGLGAMGNAMAQNLQRSITSDDRVPLRFYNRTAARGEALRKLGGVQCESVRRVVECCDVVFVSLSDDAALEGVVKEILGVGDVRGKVVVDTTTVHPDTSRGVGEALSNAGARFVAAPVFGATPMAEAGRLLIAMAGPESAVSLIAPMLKGVLARDVLVVSDKPEKAVLLKTIGNFMIAGIMEIVAESHVFAEKAGLGSQMLEALIEQNFGTLAHSDSMRMTGGIYCPGTGQSPYSDLNLAVKDVGHGLSSAADVGVRLGVGELIMQNLKKAKQYSDEHGHRQLDSSSLYGVLREDAGLDFRTDFVRARDEA